MPSNGLELQQCSSSAHFRRIRQVAAEVHDQCGRLKKFVDLLRRHGFRVAVQPQCGGDVAGYRMVVPRELQLFYVYAVRRPRSTRAPKTPSRVRC